SIDTANPSVVSVDASDGLITDADTGLASFSVDVVFDQAMDTGVAPTLTFAPSVASTLSFSGGSWSGDGLTYTATYDVADANLDVSGVTIDVTGAKDENGNGQTDYTPSAEFSIDTANPSVVSVDASDGLITDADTGLASFSVDVVFDQAMDTGVAPTLTFAPSVASTLSFSGGSWSGDGLTYTATYDVAGANLDVSGDTIDVTGAKDENGNGQSDYTPSAEFSIDTANPSVVSVDASDLLITDADTGLASFSVDVVFDQAMDTGVAPTLTFAPSVASTLSFSGGSWSGDGLTYTATYDVADANLDVSGVTIDVTGAKDENGNGQTDYTPSAEFSIDTANPSVVSVDASDLLITDADTGLASFSVDVVFDQAMDTGVAPTLTFA